MSLTGLLLDVSGSMRNNIGSGIDEEGGPWAQSIFKVIDDLIEHDLTSENRIFAIGVGVNGTPEIFDIIGTLKEIEKLEMGSDEKRMRSTRPTWELIDEILDILERNGARNIGRWKSEYITSFRDELSEYMALLMLKELQSNKEFVKNVVQNLPSAGIVVPLYPKPHYPANDLRGIRQDVHEVLKEAKSYLLRHNEKRRDINAIVDILEKNGARNIRQWVRNIALIEDEVTDKMAEVTLKELESNEEFREKFVYEFLPSTCRDNAIVKAAQSIPILGSGLSWMEDTTVRQLCSNFRSATGGDIHEVKKKAKSYVLKDVQIAMRHFFKKVKDHSIFSVQDASRIIRGCVDEKELSTERKKELLENVEPFIYGRTPLYESLEKAAELFERDNSENKMLFVLSDGIPTDGSSDDNVKIRQISLKLSSSVHVVSCFVTRSTDIDPKQLYDTFQPGWESGANFLFSLSSHVPTQHLPRAILAKYGWKIDINNNETRLFAQVNHPDNLREACNLAKKVVGNSEALSELLVSVNLDIYISQTTSNFTAERQAEGENTCYAFACAAVLHMAMKRIHGRDGGHPEFEELKEEMIREHGKDSANTKNVLEKICPKYRLKCRKVSINGAKKAISKKRPVVARYRLTKNERNAFKKFYKANPTGILTQKQLDVRKRPAQCSDLKGHAVVLTSYNSECLTFMNSWGDKFGDSGFFRVENAKVLGEQLEFFDVYWKLNELSEEEKERYRKSDSEAATKLFELLKGLKHAKYKCPGCGQESLVTEFSGTLSKVRCPKCPCEFLTNDNAGNILALNIYLISLSR